VKLTPNEVLKLRHLGHAAGLLPTKPEGFVPRQTKYTLARKGLVVICPGRTLSESYSVLTPAGRAEVEKLK
jgi:hypothetical protein